MILSFESLGADVTDVLSFIAVSEFVLGEGTGIAKGLPTLLRNERKQQLIQTLKKLVTATIIGRSTGQWPCPCGFYEIKLLDISHPFFIFHFYFDLKV